MCGGARGFGLGFGALGFRDVFQCRALGFTAFQDIV